MKFVIPFTKAKYSKRIDSAEYREGKVKRTDRSPSEIEPEIFKWQAYKERNDFVVPFV